MYEHFREAADSVLAQTHDDVELVVVVDGTPEVYDRVAEDYGDREDTVIACNDENVGLLASRNRGAELASGDVVAFEFCHRHSELALLILCLIAIVEDTRNAVRNSCNRPRSRLIYLLTRRSCSTSPLCEPSNTGT